MKSVGSVLLLAAALVFGLVLMAMAIGGLVKGAVYHTAGCPPIELRKKPIKFVVWTLCLLAMSLGCLAGAVALARKILDAM